MEGITRFFFMEYWLISAFLGPVKVKICFPLNMIRWYSKVWVKPWLSESKQDPRIRENVSFATKARICTADLYNSGGLSANFGKPWKECLQWMFWTFDWGNSPSEPFLTSNWLFWQMTQMSYRCLICITEKIRYLDKLSLSEPVQAPGRGDCLYLFAWL